MSSFKQGALGALLHDVGKKGCGFFHEDSRGRRIFSRAVLRGDMKLEDYKF